MEKFTYVVDWTTKSIKIESYPLSSDHFGWNPYARFTVYPATNIQVKTNVGTLVYKGVISKLVSESISITKKITQANMVINQLISQDGFFFDINDNLVNPGFTASNGLLQTTVDCVGTAIIEYLTTVALYEYNADIQTGGATVKSGLVWAYDIAAPKNVTTYEVPIAEFKSTEQSRIARIYREILVADKRYEMPTTFTDTEISYAHYTSADISELDTSTRKDEMTQVELLWDGFTLQTRDRYSKDWCYPVTDDLAGFLDVAWKISVDIPVELDGNMAVTNAIAALRTKYGL